MYNSRWQQVPQMEICIYIYTFPSGVPYWMAPSIHSLFFGLCGRWRHRSIGSLALTDYHTINISHILLFFSPHWWHHQSIAYIYAFVVDGTIKLLMFLHFILMAPSIYSFLFGLCGQWCHRSLGFPGTYRLSCHQYFSHFVLFFHHIDGAINP